MNHHQDLPANGGKKLHLIFFEHTDLDLNPGAGSEVNSHGVEKRHGKDEVS